MGGKVSCSSFGKHNKPEVLIVDDESDVIGMVRDILEDDGYIVRTAINGTEALEMAYAKEPDVVLLDIWLRDSEVDGMTVLEKLRERYCYLQVIVVSGHGSIQVAINALNSGAYYYIEKPFCANLLKLIIKRAIESSMLQKENDSFRASFDQSDLVGNSQAVKHVRNMISKIAPTSRRVLISGKLGTGKELVARLIHSNSKCASSAFMVIRPSIFMEDDYVERLFGSEVEDSGYGQVFPPRVGLIEQANGGTLFIDEVSELPRDVQLKLLRLLQDGKFLRKNGRIPVSVDVRVITSTSEDLKKLIMENKFREDLYYRICVVSIDIPSLSERSEDIPVLCDYFMKLLCNKFGLPVKVIDDEAMTVIQSYSWPGNVRQLINFIEWLIIMSGSSDSSISVGSLPREVVSGVPLADNMSTKVISSPLKEAREEFEKQYLRAQLSRFGGNISKTSEFIGMERSALHRKLKVLGL